MRSSSHPRRAGAARPLAALTALAALAALGAASPAAAQSAPFSSRYGAVANALYAPQQGGRNVATASASSSAPGSSQFSSASMLDGTVRATAASSNVPPSCWPATCGWNASASAYAWNTVVLRPEFNDGRAYNISWSFTIDGSITYGRFGGGASGEAAYYFGTSADAAVRPTTRRLGNDTINVSATVGITGPTTFYLYSSVVATAYGSATADYGHTMRFAWSIPEGVSVESAAPDFVAPTIVRTTTAPEPASLALLGAGVAVLAAATRRRRRR